MQGKLFQKCTHLLYCSVLTLGGNVNKRRMSKLDMGSIFHIKNQWYILVIGNYYVNYQNYQNLMPLTFSDTKRTLIWCIYSYWQIPPKENWFQCVRRVYTIAINFPSITPLDRLCMVVELSIYVLWTNLFETYQTILRCVITELESTFKIIFMGKYILRIFFFSY